MSQAELDAERALVTDALAGRPEALEQVLQVLGRVPAMVRAKHSRMGSPLGEDELEDVVQDTVLAVWRKLDRFRGDSALSTWVFGFAVRELFKGITKRSRNHDRRLNLEQVDPEHLAGESDAEALGVTSDSEALHSALGELEESCASILRAKHFDKWTFERISREWSIPLGTAKTRYYQAFDRLRGKLVPRLRKT